MDQGDTVLVTVGGPQAGVIAHLREQGLAQGRSGEVHLHDHRRAHQPLPRLTVSSGALVETTLRQAFVQGSLEEAHGPMVSLLSVLALLFRVGEPADPLCDWLRWVSNPWSHLDQMRTRSSALPPHIRQVLEGFDRSSLGPDQACLQLGQAQLRTWAQAVLAHVGESPLVEVEPAAAVVGLVLPTEGPVLGWVSWMWQAALGGYIGRVLSLGPPITMISLDLPLGWGWANAISPSNGGLRASVIQLVSHAPAPGATTCSPDSWAGGVCLELGPNAQTPAWLRDRDQSAVSVHLALHADQAEGGLRGGVVP